jgi:predicted phage tail protein
MLRNRRDVLIENGELSIVGSRRKSYRRIVRAAVVGVSLTAMGGVNAQLVANTAAGAATRAIPQPYQHLAVPSVPLDLQAVAGHGQITLTWTPPTSDGGSSLVGYAIYEVDSSGSSAVIAVNDGSATTFTVESLMSSRSYTFTVQAVNKVGNSLPSNEVTATPANNIPQPYQHFPRLSINV